MPDSAECESDLILFHSCPLIPPPHTHTPTYTHAPHTHTYTPTHAHTKPHTHPPPPFTKTHTHTHTHTLSHTLSHTCTHAHVHTWTRTHTHTCAHTHTHSFFLVFSFFNCFQQGVRDAFMLNFEDCITNKCVYQFWLTFRTISRTCSELDGAEMVPQIPPQLKMVIHWGAASLTQQ